MEQDWVSPIIAFIGLFGFVYLCMHDDLVENDRKKQEILDSYLVSADIPERPAKTITEQFEEVIVANGFSLTNSIIGNDKLTAIAVNPDNKIICLLTREQLVIHSRVIPFNDIISMNPTVSSEIYTIKGAHFYIRVTINDINEPHIKLSFIDSSEYSANHSIETYYKWCSILEVIIHNQNSTI